MKFGRRDFNLGPGHLVLAIIDILFVTPTGF